jgi:poly-gamma-glutamate synthesis protein (capsule biosynthesis protein)
MNKFWELTKSIARNLGSRRIAVCFLLVLAAAGAMYFLVNKNHIAPANNNYHKAQPMQREFYETAYQFQKKQFDMSGQDIVAGVIPHHLLAADLIAEFFSNLAEKSYDTVILLGPNHFNSGRAGIITSAYDWQTPYGILKHDDTLLDAIKSRPDTSVEEDLFGQEHSINSEVAFIKKTFPQATFLPLVLRRTITPAQAEELGKNLLNLTTGKKVLVLASTDFSHYQDSTTAQRHDQTSLTALRGYDFGSVYDLDVDSPASLTAVMTYGNLYQAQFKLLHNSNSALLSGQPDVTSTTSYITGYWGNFDKQATVSMLFFGDIMLDRHVKDKIKQNGFDYLLNNFQLPGEWQTPDVMMANLEGAATTEGAHYEPQLSIDFAFAPNDVAQLKNYGFNFFSLANNHILDQGQVGLTETQKNLEVLGFNYVGCPDRQVGDCSFKIENINDVKIGWLAYSMVYGILDEEKLREQIETVSAKTDLTITMIHWGVEYEGQARSNQVALAHQMIDAGADAIIGSHPHVVQNVEIYNNKPIFYSLGNFIFDQYFSAETQQGLGVGLIFNNGKMEITLLPFASKVSQVELMDGDEKQEFLSWLAGDSEIDESYKMQIKNGIIKIN